MGPPKGILGKGVRGGHGERALFVVIGLDGDLNGLKGDLLLLFELFSSLLMESVLSLMTGSHFLKEYKSF